MPSLTLAEARARAAQISLVRYDVHIDLTDVARFASRSTVFFWSEEPETFLELHRGEGVVVTVNGVVVDPAYDGHRIALSGLLTDQANEVVVEARLPYVTDGDGMHPSPTRRTASATSSAYVGVDITQRVFACFDQVDLKAIVRLSVTAPRPGRSSPTGRHSAQRTVGGTSGRRRRSRSTCSCCAPGRGTRGPSSTPASRWDGTRGGRSRRSWTATSTSCAGSPSSASTTTPASSTSRSRSTPTTRSSSRSSTGAPWRTRAASPSATSTCRAAGSRRSSSGPGRW